MHAGSQDFRRIAQFLDGRTTGDCVVFYYRTQKLDEFAAVRRKMQLKKRRMQSENNRAVSYMGIPMAGAAKRGELTTIANPGEFSWHLKGPCTSLVPRAVHGPETILPSPTWASPWQALPSAASSLASPTLVTILGDEIFPCPHTFCCVLSRSMVQLLRAPVMWTHITLNGQIMGWAAVSRQLVSCLPWSAVQMGLRAEAPLVSCFQSLTGARMLLQTLAGCSRHWCRCPRPCPARALGPSPGGQPGPGAPLPRARQCLALPRRDALLARSWGMGRWRRSCSMAMRTGLPLMRAPLLRPPSALAGKALMHQIRCL